MSRRPKRREVERWTLPAGRSYEAINALVIGAAARARTNGAGAPGGSPSPSARR